MPAFCSLLLPSYYSNNFSSKIDVSILILQTFSVLKGCNLRPLPFSLLLNDLEGYLENHSSGSCQLNSYRLQLMMFADDIVLLANTDKKVYTGINKRIGGIL